MNKPAILGGSPLFDTMLSINKPTLPGVRDMEEELETVLSSGMLTNSAKVSCLEEECSAYLGVKHAIAVSCCTSGLLLVLKLLGIGGEVIVPSFTFPATVHALIWNNLKPVFVDIDPHTFNIDPAEVEKKITPDTSAIMAVYIFGNPPRMEALEEIALRHNLKIVSDAAHAFGTRYGSRFAGNFGDAEVFSLAPTKVIVSGEGGIVATNNDKLAADLRIARDYGNPGNYNCRFVGLNARMSEIHALIGIKCLSMLEKNIARRQELIKLYKSGLGDIPGLSFQKIDPAVRSTHNYFPILVDEEAFGLSNTELSRALQEENIMTRRYFYPPVHEQEAYTEYKEACRGKLPATDEVCGKICCLPLFSHLPEEAVGKVCLAIRQIGENSREVKKALEKRESVPSLS